MPELSSAATSDQSIAAIETQDLCFSYGTKQVLHNINLHIPCNQVTAFIGPSGCGKSTLIRCFNRINDRIANANIINGKILVHGIDIYQDIIALQELRRRIGMVFQKYNPFEMSIYENVIFSLRIAGVRNKQVLDETVEQSLRSAALWDEVKDRLHSSALSLSGGQQQRLCIARAISNRPSILLMDEPCAALDPLATLKIEELILNLKKDFTIVIVTHNMEQASRCSDQTAFFYMGKLIEFNGTHQIFENPQQADTEAYITGRFS